MHLLGPHRRARSREGREVDAMDIDHLDWPFFAAEHRSFGDKLGSWVDDELTAFEADEGGDGRAARAIFERLAQDRWLDASLPDENGAIDLRTIAFVRERCAYSSAIADVAISEPWLGILPV